MKNFQTICSYHGAQRVVERTQCKQKNVAEYISKIWKEGKKIDSYGVKTSMYSYLVNVQRNGGSDRAVRVKGNAVYIFNRKGTVLITCYNIPQKVIQNKHKGARIYG